MFNKYHVDKIRDSSNTPEHMGSSGEEEKVHQSDHENSHPNEAHTNRQYNTGTFLRKIR